MTQVKPYSGIFPIAPVPFSDNGDLDLDGMRRVLDCMIDQGVDGICVLANYSEQFLLTDAERHTLLDLSMSHVNGRVPVIVTCSHFSTLIAADRGRRAAKAGAKMLMLMPPYHGALLRADEAGIIAQFAAVADAAQIPLMCRFLGRRHRCGTTGLGPASEKRQGTKSRAIWLWGCSGRYGD